MDGFELVLFIISGLLMLFGCLGSFIHRVPGAIFAYVGVVLLNFIGNASVAIWVQVVIPVIIVLSFFMKKYMPKVTDKIHEISDLGKSGSIIGSALALLASLAAYVFLPSDVALIITIASFIVFPFGISFWLAYYSTKTAKGAVLEATASYLTYLSGSIINIGLCLWCMYILYTAFNN